MTLPYWMSYHTCTLEPGSDERLESAFDDADAEARIIAAELMSPNDVGYEALVEKYYDKLCERLYVGII